MQSLCLSVSTFSRSSASPVHYFVEMSTFVSIFLLPSPADQMAFVVAMASAAWVAGGGVPGRGFVVVLSPREGVTPQAPCGGGLARRGPSGAALQAAGAQRVDEEALVGAAQRTLHPGGERLGVRGPLSWLGCLDDNN